MTVPSGASEVSKAFQSGRSQVLDGSAAASSHSVTASALAASRARSIGVPDFRVR